MLIVPLSIPCRHDLRVEPLCMPVLGRPGLRPFAVVALALSLGCAPPPSAASTPPLVAPAVSPAPASASTPSPAVEAPSQSPPPSPATHCVEWSTTNELPLAFALRDGWVGPDGSAVLVGDGSTIVHHRDGRWWTELAPSDRWAAVWGAGPDDVFAVSYFGTIAHFDGHAWTKQAEVGHLDDVWGTGPDHVVAVGDDGIYQFDGTTWTQQHREPDLRSVWGTAPDHVLAAGRSGKLLRYDGERWTSMASPTSAKIIGLSGTAPDDVVLATEAEVLRFDGRRWSRTLRVTLDELILAAPSLGDGSMLVIQDEDEERFGRPMRGSTDLRVREGERWAAIDLETAWLTGGATSAADHTYVFDHRGGIHRYDRSGLQVVVEPGPSNWRAMHRIGRDRIAVTHDFEIWREHDGAWERVPTKPNAQWYDAWIDESGRVLAVGTVAGRAAVMVRDGDEWQPLWRGPRRRDAMLFAIRASGVGEYLAVGNHGLVVRGNATEWAIEPTGTRAWLRSLWVSESGRAQAVGETADARGRGVILERDGGAWTKLAERVDPLADVWGVDGQVYAVGGFVDYDPVSDELRGEAVILRADGEAWARVQAHPREDGQTYERVAGNTSNDVFAVRAYHYGDGGEDYSSWALDHFDGQTWTEHAKGDGSVGSLSVAPDEVIVAVGNGLHRWACRRPGTGAPGE